MNIQLEDLVPTEVEFTLKTMPNEVFKLRPVSAQDHINMAKKYGNEELQKIFSKLKTSQLLEIAFMQMDYASQAHFKKQKVKVVNEAGDDVEIDLGGVALFRQMIEGPREAMNVIERLLEAVGISQPLLEKIEADQKKRLQENIEKQIGERSSTSSEPNTDGPANIASAEPSEKSIGD